jgi:hypothetical protein
MIMKYNLLVLIAFLLFSLSPAHCMEIPENPDYFYFESVSAQRSYRAREITMNNGRVYSIYKTNCSKTGQFSYDAVYAKRYKMTPNEVKKLIRLLNKINFCQFPDRLKSNIIGYPHWRWTYKLICKTNGMVIKKEIHFENWPQNRTGKYLNELNQINDYFEEKMPGFAVNNQQPLIASPVFPAKPPKGFPSDSGKTP